ncbi:TDT family transporter [Tissierella creatinophila]|uniref:Potassium-tellurite ethidium and proflavin transporter n=1 Tax=Tissierella creatinophila DSM 6911 TaxID=1123403 RepID=A0A1U7M671_TISCR|nr:TDT family transporter [Tissierella creatinophila]OLS02688.1 potassium-tellurite ethidium and proflavin transporter [Tissierella creatinophila DSM 6911]
MNQLLKRIPIPMAGLMLALAAGGNLVGSYGTLYRNILGIISAILLVFLLAKIIKYPSAVKEELKNPVVASVFPTLTMGMMLLATYIKPFTANVAFGMWIVSILGHIALMVKFTMDYIIKLDIKKVFPSWFIVYVGIVVGSVTAPVFEMQSLGKIFFWVGIVSYFLLLPIVFKKVRLGTMPEPALPTLAIFAAPVALCLAGYMNSFETKNMVIVWGLVILSQLNYIFVLSQLPKLLKLKFYPSFSGFTFPLVISAISIKLTNGFLVNSGQTIYVLRYIVKFEEIVAVLMVLYVLLKYIQFLTGSAQSKTTVTVGK